MTWTPKAVVYRLRTPLHVGYKPWGVVALTRYYVPGRNMWAALVEAYALKRGGDFGELGRTLKSDFRFSYFYLTDVLAPDNVNIYKPIYGRKGVSYGTYAAAAFERRFISARPGTAILPTTGSAEDGSLHEVEYVKPRTRDEGSTLRHTFLSGVIWYGDNSSLDLNELIEMPLAVGGERTYGFGRLEPVSCKDELARAVLRAFELRSEGVADAGSPRVKTKVLRAHTPRSPRVGIEFGDYEPLVWRTYEDQENDEGRIGFGQRVEYPVAGQDVNVFYVPGTTLKNEAEFEVQEDGLWVLREGVGVSE